VFLVEHSASRKLYAMKKISKEEVDKNQWRYNINIERQILLQNCHPNLVRLHYCFQTNSEVIMVMDYAKGGELFNHIPGNHILKSREVSPSKSEDRESELISMRDGMPQKEA
jgi:serine/threonine protein kinase